MICRCHSHAGVVLSMTKFDAVHHAGVSTLCAAEWQTVSCPMPVCCWEHARSLLQSFACCSMRRQQSAVQQMLLQARQSSAARLPGSACSQLVAALLGFAHAKPNAGWAQVPWLESGSGSSQHRLDRATHHQHSAPSAGHAALLHLQQL